MQTNHDDNRREVMAITSEFLSKSADRKLYSFTLTPHMRALWNAGIWSNINSREDYVLDLFDLFELSLNRKLFNNWKRRGSKPAFSLGAVEHYEKNSSNLVAPHIHGILAIDLAFVTVLEDQLTPTGGRIRLDLDCLKGTPWVAKRHLVHSIVIEPLITQEDLERWSNYSFDIKKLTFNTTKRGIRNVDYKLCRTG
jgi:hypothetical protein